MKVYVKPQDSTISTISQAQLSILLVSWFAEKMASVFVMFESRAAKFLIMKFFFHINSYFVILIKLLVLFALFDKKPIKILKC